MVAAADAAERRIKWGDVKTSVSQDTFTIATP
jgi:hypothetical protein